MKGSESTHDPIGNVAVNMITKMNNKLLKFSKSFLKEGKEVFVSLGKEFASEMSSNFKELFSSNSVKKETQIEEKVNDSKRNDFKDGLGVSDEVKDNTIKAGQNFEIDNGQIDNEQRDDGENTK